MSWLRNSFLVIVLFWCFCSCKKQEIPTDKFVQGEEAISALNLAIVSVGKDFIEVSWDRISSNRIKEFTYSIYLDDQIIADNLTVKKYSFIQLNQGSNYIIKLVVSVQGSKQTEQVVKASTLVASSGQVKLFKQYEIHGYSQIVAPTVAVKTSDGGHLIAGGLHSSVNDFAVVFKTDSKGDMQWYRLLPTGGFNFGLINPFNLFLNNEKRAVLLFGKSIFDFDLESGEILATKVLEGIEANIVASVVRKSDKILVAVTNKGKIFSLNMQTLTIDWLQTALNTYDCLSIQRDSKNNLFILCGGDIPLTLLKFNEFGVLLKRIPLNAVVVHASLMVDNEDNLLVVANVGSDSPIYLVKINNVGDLITSVKLYDKMQRPQAFLGINNEVIIYGDIDGIGLKRDGAVYRMDKNLNITSRKIYNQDFNSSLGAVTQNGNGSLNLFLNYIDYDDPSARRLLYIQTDENGNI